MSEYKSWTNEALIARIHDLEARLTHVQGPQQSLVKGTRSGPKTKRARTDSPGKPFDFHKYRQKYVAFKFAYLGWHFNGLVTQDMPTPLPTVEEEIFHALLKTKLIEDPDSCRYSRCGRTDKGVSAMGQVMALNVRSAFLKARPALHEDDDETGTSTRDEGGLEKDKVSEEGRELPWLEQLNGCLPPSIRILAYDDTIAEDFDARFSCRGRHYKYLFAPRVPGAPPLDVRAMRAACAYFQGTHDFRNFCKLDASKQITNFTRSILRCEVREWVPPASEAVSSVPLGLYALELEGTAFLWHQVRCMTAILLLVGQGLERPELVQEMLDVQRYPTKPVYEMADDWPLTLYDCDFGEQVNWKYSTFGQRVYENAFVTMHEARIKDAVSSFMVDAASKGFDQEVMKPGNNLGDGRIRVSAKYVPIAERKRMPDVTILNAAWAEKKERKRAERNNIQEDIVMTPA